MNRYSILVNTCDKFNDCWSPYFKLQEKYWKNCSGSIYLNTEFLEYKHEGLKINSLAVSKGDEMTRLSWSKCLINALYKIEDEIILYMQEDYFIYDLVKNQTIEHYVELMLADKSIDCIHLTDQGVIPDGRSSYEGLLKVKQVQRYRISCQAALWRKDTLRSYLRKWENAWQFEQYGSKRSSILKHQFYVIDPSSKLVDNLNIIPYIFTGIIQGKWHNNISEIFSKNNIDINYKLRGYIKDTQQTNLFIRSKKFIKNFHLILRSNLEFLYMKYVKK